ncbi:MAG: magnesium-translocating P-type ATPase [Desulfosporosinus sp.]|nr:magnesium-translocating P-type ATPase [Desulfosporosinus sp.]
MEKPPFWTFPSDELLKELTTETSGLTQEEAEIRIKTFGANLLKQRKSHSNLVLFFAQFKSPIILILIFAAVLSAFLQDPADTIIILAIVLGSGLLGFWQEVGAAGAVEKLLSIVEIKAVILRNGVVVEIPLAEVVPGDITVLSAGGGIPGDCLLIESVGLFVDEAALTGETYPVEKSVGVKDADTALAQRSNVLYMGTHVVSGTGKAVIVKTGLTTEFGAVSQRLRLRAPETEFELGIRHFGYLLMEVTLLLVIAIFAINVYLARPVLDSFLFSMALAVGLTPQLLPAIISVNLSRGAKNMASKKVIVKRLSSIENFGSMNVLCSDKTGTLTEGFVHLHSTLDYSGHESEKVLLFAYINASLEKGYANPIDEAIRSHKQFDLKSYEKLSEIPYDFIRKRLSILVKSDDKTILITKGALKNVLDVCSFVEGPNETVIPIQQVLPQIQTVFSDLGTKGLRTLGVAYKKAEDTELKDQEKDMTFLGFMVLYDPPKEGIAETVNTLKEMGITLKVITGDNKLVAMSLSKQIGLANPEVLTGPELYKMSDEALIQKLGNIDLFAEIEPNQKERVILALKKAGNVVGYLGDGINDASALHAADVGISVNSAVDVAKDAADIVLLEKDLSVLIRGVKEGRVTFANTLKYVFMATSANFGNMFSMAGASLFLSFLPLLPKQILLTNLMTDLPEMTISTDSVDPEMIDGPRRWDIKFIRKFMLTFGLLSSVFDYLTFGTLLFFLHATPEQFRTGWFIESVLSASLIVLVIRTRKPFYQSKPGKALFWTTLAVAVAIFIFPYSFLGPLFGFVPLPAVFFPVLGIILLLYIASAEIAKKLFYKGGRYKNQ